MYFPNIYNPLLNDLTYKEKIQVIQRAKVLSGIAKNRYALFAARILVLQSIVLPIFIGYVSSNIKTGVTVFILMVWVQQIVSESFRRIIYEPFLTPALEEFRNKQ